MITIIGTFIAGTIVGALSMVVVAMYREWRDGA